MQYFQHSETCDEIFLINSNDGDRGASNAFVSHSALPRLKPAFSRKHSLYSDNWCTEMQFKFA